MGKRRAIALIGAVVLALAAAGLAFWYVSNVRTEAVEQEDTVMVLVAAEDIPARTSGEAVVSNNLVAQEEVPRRLVVPGALASETDLQDRVLLASVSKGQQLVSSQLAAPETESLAFRIKNGMRAVSVTIDRARAVAGLIQPGDRVDVVATFDYEIFNQGSATLGQVIPKEEVARVKSESGIDLNASKSSVTRTILQQAEVLHIDPPDQLAADTRRATEAEGDTEAQAPDLPVAVLMVSPLDAEKLIFAEEMGVVAFSLVPAEDTQRVSTPGRMLGNEFSPTPQPEPTEAKPVAAVSTKQ